MNCSTSNCGNTNVFDELDQGMQKLMRGSARRESTTIDDPRLSLYEFDSRYVVECDVPGVDIGDISLQLENQILTISGQRKVSTAEGDARVLFNERTASSFNRRLQLGVDVDYNAVDAELSAGVLRITIAKPPQVLPRKIEIRRQTPSA